MKKADYQEGKPNPYILDCTLVGRAFGGDSRCETVSTSEVHDYSKPYVFPNPVGSAISIKGMRYDAISHITSHLIASRELSQGHREGYI